MRFMGCVDLIKLASFSFKTQKQLRSSNFSAGLLCHEKNSLAGVFSPQEFLSRRSKMSGKSFSVNPHNVVSGGFKGGGR